MPGRAHRAERGVGLAPLEPVDHVEARAGREHRHLERLGARRRVGVEVPAAVGAELLERVDVACVVHADHGLACGRLRLDAHEGVARRRRRGHRRGRRRVVGTARGGAGPGRGRSTAGASTRARSRPREATSAFRLGPMPRSRPRPLGRRPHVRASGRPASRRPASRRSCRSPNGPRSRPWACGTASRCSPKRGYGAVVTAALEPRETQGFFGAGFTVRERLHLLERDLDELPPLPAATPAKGPAAGPARGAGGRRASRSRRSGASTTARSTTRWRPRRRAGSG